MDKPPQGARIVRFGPYEADRQTCELRRDGQRIPLQIQPFRVLEALIDRAGDVVTRAELREKIWPSTVYVDFDHGLNNSINRLRQALGDSTDAPRFIETLPRVGYRFIYALDSNSGTGRDQRRSRVETFISHRVAVAGLVVMLLAAVVLAARQASKDELPMNNSLAESVQLPTTPEAYDAYLRGHALFEQRNKESIALSIEYLKLATTLDPDFAAAHAELAEAYVTAGGNTLVKFLTSADAYGPALAAAQRAIQLDPNLAEAHSALASVISRLQPWSAEADVIIEESYRRAIELDPTVASVPLFYGNFLSARGRSAEAISFYRQGLKLDPLSASVNSRLGAELVATGMLDEGLALLRKTVELDPWQFNARLRLGWALAGIGDLDEAENAFTIADRISPASVQSLAGLAFVAARKGDLIRANALLETMLPRALELGDPFNLAIVYVGMQDHDNALEWLTQVARETRTLHKSGPYGIDAAIYDPLRDDPRFDRIEREVASRLNRAPSVARFNAE